ncbi:hypothetical protein ACFQ3Z_43345 [Streptomyces nogalater]
MRFNLIGLFEIITDDGERLTPKAPKVCQTLAVLALHARKAVTTDVLVRELWGRTRRPVPSAPCRRTSTTRAGCSTTPVSAPPDASC